MNLYSLFVGPNNNIQVLDESSNLWEFNLKKLNWERKDFFRWFPEIVEDARGGARCNQRLTWFFKGRQLWVYSNYTLLSGFPYRIPESIFPTNLYTTLWKDNKLYGLKGLFMYEFIMEDLQGARKNPEKISSVFPGLPSVIQAAINYQGDYYFFKDEL